MTGDPLGEHLRGHPGRAGGGPVGGFVPLQLGLWGLAALVSLTQLTAHRLGYHPALGLPLCRAPPQWRPLLEGLVPVTVAVAIAALVWPGMRRYAGVAGLAATLTASPAQGPLYPPLRYPLWVLAWKDDPALGPVILLPLTLGGLGLALAGFSWLSLRAPPGSGNVHGSSRFASFEETRRHGLFGSVGIVLGRLAAPGGLWLRSRTLRHGGSEHVLFIGYTRSGNTSGCAIPTALDWPDHLVVFDPKGAEVFTTTAGAKAAAGHRVLRFAPTEEGWARWNPLWEIEPGVGEIGELQRLAGNLITAPPNHTGDPHWILSARQAFVALALHVLYAEEAKSKKTSAATAKKSRLDRLQ